MNNSISELNNDINGLKGDLVGVENIFYVDGDSIPVYSTSNGYRLNESNGLCFEDSSYKLIKYAVTAGTKIKVVSDDRFQFQNFDNVNTWGVSNKIGNTYQAGTFYITVPETATYLIISTLAVGSIASVYIQNDRIGKLSEVTDTNFANFVNNLKKSTGFEEIVFSNPNKKQYINTSSTVVSWDNPNVSNYTKIKWAVVECENGDEFTINGKGGSADRLWAFANSQKEILVRSKENITATDLVITAPQNSKYLIINDETNQASYVGRTLKQNKERKVLNDYCNMFIVNCANISFANKSISDVGAVADSNYFISSDFIDIKHRTKCIYTGSEGIGSAYYEVYICEYSKNDDKYFVKRTQTLFTPDNIDKIVDFSESTKYIKIMLGHSFSTKVTTEVSERCGCSIVLVGNREDEYGKQIETITNLRKKLLQLQKVKWTALLPYPNYINNNNVDYPAGDYTGVPYSSAKELDKFVGFNVSLLTYVSAVHNPYSLMYTENINGKYSKSDYGLTYHGVNCGSYFGMVCNTFVLYGMGYTIPWNTGEWAGLCRLGVFTKLPIQSISELQIGDIIWEPGHGNVITDITKENGVVTKVEWNEVSGISNYTALQFNDRIKMRGGIIYRCNDIYKNVIYSPSQFVQVYGEETLSTYEYNEDICTFAGDYASFRLGEEIWINYNLGSTVYDTLNLYKDGTLINTYTLEDGHKISIGSSLMPGIYTATLEIDGTESEATHFEIIDTTSSVTTENGNITVNFSDSTANPIYVQMCYSYGTSLGIYPLSDQEKIKGECTFNARKLNRFFYTNGIHDDVYVKVFFGGQYGVTRSMTFVDLN